MEDYKITWRDIAMCLFFALALALITMWVSPGLFRALPSKPKQTQDSTRIAEDAVKKCIYIIDTTSVNKGMYLTLKHRYERVLADSLLKP